MNENIRGEKTHRTLQERKVRKHDQDSKRAKEVENQPNKLKYEQKRPKISESLRARQKDAQTQQTSFKTAQNERDAMRRAHKTDTGLSE